MAKHKNRALITVVIVLFSLLLIVLIIGLVLFFLIYDNTDNTDGRIKENDVSFQTALSCQMVSAFVNTGESGVAAFCLDEYDVNELLYAIARGIDVPGIGIKSIYVEAQNGEYRLCVPVNIYGVSSFMSGNLNVTEADGVFRLAIDSIYIGGIKADSSVMSVLGIERAVESLNQRYSVTASIGSGEIIVEFSREDLYELIDGHTKDYSYNGLVMALYNVFMLDTDAVTMTVNNPADISVFIDFSRFDGKQSTLLEAAGAQISEWLDEGVIQTQNVNLAAEYYIKGYEYLDDDEKALISKLLSPVRSDEDIQSYEGLLERQSLSFTDILLSQYDASPFVSEIGFKIADIDINAGLTVLDLIGSSYVFTNYRDNGCAYFAIQAVYTVIGDDALNLYIDINLNGYLLTVDAGFLCEQSPTVSVTANLSEIMLGNYRLSDENTKKLFGFLCKTVSDDWLYLDEENMSLTMDFSDSFSDDPVLYSLLTDGSIVTSCRKYAEQSGGYVYIVFS